MSDLKISKNFIINEIKPLIFAKKNDITFFDSIKYLEDVKNTKCELCVTTEKLKKYMRSSMTTTWL